MKGLVFTEFLDLVDETFSLETCERMIEMSNLPSGGAYTSVGTYDAKEMFTLVSGLSTRTGIPVPDLLKTSDGTGSWHGRLPEMGMINGGGRIAMRYLNVVTTTPAAGKSARIGLRVPATGVIVDVGSPLRSGARS